MSRDYLPDTIITTEMALLLPAALPYLSGAISGSLSEIAISFPNYPEGLIKMVYSLTRVSSITCGLLTSYLITKVSAKIVLLVYMLLSGLGGLLSFVGSKHFGLLLVSSVLVGFCGGLIPLCAVIIDTMYDDKKKNDLLGKQYSVCCSGGIVIMLLSAWLSADNWQKNYYLFFLIIPIILVSLFKVPLIPKVVRIIEYGKKNDSVFRYPLFWFCCAVSLLFYSTVCIYQGNVSFVVSEITRGAIKLGSIPNVVMCAGGLLAGILYSKIESHLKEGTLTLALCVVIVGLSSVRLFPSLISVFLCAACSGFGMSTGLPYLSYWASKTVPSQLGGGAIAIVNTFINLGALLSPFLYSSNVKGWYSKISGALLADAICDRIVHDSYTVTLSGNESMRKHNGIPNI